MRINCEVGGNEQMMLACAIMVFSPPFKKGSFGIEILMF